MHKIQISLLTVLLTSILFPMKILAFSGNDYIFMNNFIMEITLVSVIFISIFAEIKTAVLLQLFREVYCFLYMEANYFTCGIYYCFFRE